MLNDLRIYQHGTNFHWSADLCVGFMGPVEFEVNGGVLVADYCQTLCHDEAMSPAHWFQRDETQECREVSYKRAKAEPAAGLDGPFWLEPSGMNGHVSSNWAARSAIDALPFWVIQGRAGSPKPPQQAGCNYQSDRKDHPTSGKFQKSGALQEGWMGAPTKRALQEGFICEPQSDFSR
jgi:hypothetical protein